MTFLAIILYSFLHHFWDWPWYIWAALFVDAIAFVLGFMVAKI